MWGESPLLSQSGSPSARPPSAPGAAFLAPVSVVLPDSWGPPKIRPQRVGLETSEPQGNSEQQARGAQHLPSSRIAPLMQILLP